jgi:hypothetical protein
VPNGLRRARLALSAPSSAPQKGTIERFLIRGNQPLRSRQGGVTRSSLKMRLRCVEQSGAKSPPQESLVLDATRCHKKPLFCAASGNNYIN